jgi:Tfp pilus assembly protein PilX
MCSGPSGEQGFTLIIGLILLVALSISTFAVAKTGFFQEKMAGISQAMTKDFFAAETAVKIAEDTFSTLTDLTGETLLDSECGIKEIVRNEVGVTIRTTYYNPPPNGYNWGSGDGKKVRVCHDMQNALDLLIAVQGVNGHEGHANDYLGLCENGSLGVPDDAWVTCTDKFGTTAKRLSWQQLWDL